MEEKDRKEYEVAFIAKSEEGAHTLRKILEGHDGEVTEGASLKPAALAYKIQGERNVLFGYCRVRIAREKVAEISKELLTVADLLRFAITLPSHTKPRVKLVISEEKKARPAPAVPGTPLSNEALEKKLEEILQ